jgi:drug/metabolite transporter (DMT)-like permease
VRSDLAHVDDGRMSQVDTGGQSRRALSWLALGVVYVVWGSTYLAIRVGVRHVPPLLFAGTRYVIAGALLYPFARAASRRARTAGEPGSGEPGSGEPGSGSDAKAWLAAAVMGILLLFGGNGGVTVGERTLPSGLAAVLLATVPLWMIVFAWILRQQRATTRSTVGLAVGLCGVVVLAGAGTASGHLSAVIIVLVGAAAWGFGSVVSHRLPLPAHALLAAGMEMLVGGAVLLAAAGATGEFAHFQVSDVPATSWIAWGYLIGPGSILAFSAYNYALSHLPVSTVSTYAFVNPVVAVLLGALLLGERLTWREGLGAALVVISIRSALQT